MQYNEDHIKQIFGEHGDQNMSVKEIMDRRSTRKSTKERAKYRQKLHKKTEKLQDVIHDFMTEMKNKGGNVVELYLIVKEAAEDAYNAVSSVEEDKE